MISVIFIPLNLRSKTRRGATLLLPTLICSCQSVGTANLALPFTTSVTISISIKNIPFLSSKNPNFAHLWRFNFQLFWYTRACSSYEYFILRAMRLFNKLLGQDQLHIIGRIRSSMHYVLVFSRQPTYIFCRFRAISNVCSLYHLEQYIWSHC